jgi:broad specificity phosphatase PhoE
MPLIYMVRHGRVASNPSDAANPELSPEGRSQADTVARELSERLPRPLPILTSPLLRCRETAAPLCARWQVEPLVDRRLAEVPGPEPELLARDEWIRRSLVLDWPQFIELGQSFGNGFDAVMTTWREEVLQAVMACQTDTVMFSHFVPLNVLAGRCLRSERVACFRPDHTSITVFETRGTDIRLIERGREVKTRVS